MVCGLGSRVSGFGFRLEVQGSLLMQGTEPGVMRFFCCGLRMSRREACQRFLEGWHH